MLPATLLPAMGATRKSLFMGELRPGNHHFGIDRGYYFMWAYCLSVPHLVTYIVFFRPGKTVTAQAGCSVIRQQVERRSGFGEVFQLLDTPWAV